MFTQHHRTTRPPLLWNGIDKLKRTIICQNTTNGGLSLTDLTIKQKAIHIQKIRKIQEHL